MNDLGLKWIWTLALLHAALFALAFPPFDLWPLILAAPAPLAWAAMHARSRRALLWITFATQMMMWLWLTRFTAVLTPLGWPFFSLVMSLYPTVFVAVLSRKRLAALPMALVLPVVWVSLEFLRGEVIFNGYPWYLLAHPLIEWPLFAQSADLFGQYFVSFLAAMISGAMVDVIRRSRVEHMSIAGRLRRPEIALALILLAANLAYGAWRMQQTEPLTPGPRILAIQTNVPQSNKIGWSADDQLNSFVDFFALTDSAYRELQQRHGSRPVDLIVWPETMLPGYGLEPRDINYLVERDVFPGDIFADAVQEMYERFQTPLLLGSPAWLNLRLLEDDIFEADEKYNSAYLVAGPPPYPRYDKVVLTPYGETMPYISNWEWLEQKLLALGAPGMRFDLHASDEMRRLSIAWQGRTITFGTPICFEDTVGYLNRHMIYERGNKVGQLLVNISNDGWYTFSHADRKLHAQIARYRCIENRVPMIRSVNTGYSVSIDSCGRIVDAVDVNQGRYGGAEKPGWIADQVRLDARSSLYGRIGDLWGWITLGFFAIVIGTNLYCGRMNRSDALNVNT